MIDAEDLGPLLDLDPSQVPGLMREGQITSRFERGEGEDLGRFRVTFLHGRTTLRLIVSADGSVVQKSRIVAAPPR